MDETLEYFFYADRFGWTPDQVDALPVVYRDRFGVVAEAIAEVRTSRAPKGGLSRGGGGTRG